MALLVRCAPLAGDPVGGTSKDVRTDALSQLARVSDTSQIRIEIQNVAIPARVTPFVMSTVMSPVASPRAHSPPDFHQRFREDNATMRAAAPMDSIQRSWIGPRKDLSPSR